MWMYSGLFTVTAAVKGNYVVLSVCGLKESSRKDFYIVRHKLF